MINSSHQNLKKKWLENNYHLILLKKEEIFNLEAIQIQKKKKNYHLHQKRKNNKKMFLFYILIRYFVIDPFLFFHKKIELENFFIG